MKNFGLIPVKNFGQVSDLVFRSAQPIYNYEYQWLKNVVGIDLIVNLRAEKDRDAKYAPVHGIDSVTIPVKDHQAPSYDNVEAFNHVLIKAMAENKKVLIHCEHGHGRTSTFSVIAKILSGSTFDEAINQEKEEFNYTFKYQSQIDFLSDYAKTIN